MPKRLVRFAYVVVVATLTTQACIYAKKKTARGPTSDRGSAAATTTARRRETRHRARTPRRRHWQVRADVVIAARAVGDAVLDPSEVTPSPGTGSSRSQMNGASPTLRQ
jgi:hypothetical protein